MDKAIGQAIFDFAKQLNLFRSQATKRFFARPAYRAFPVFRQILELCAFLDFSLPVSFVGIVNIPATLCLTLPHFFRCCHFFTPQFFG
jgi:hypothetical protein